MFLEKSYLKFDRLITPWASFSSSSVSSEPWHQLSCSSKKISFFTTFSILSTRRYISSKLSAFCQQEETFIFLQTFQLCSLTWDNCWHRHPAAPICDGFHQQTMDWVQVENLPLPHSSPVFIRFGTPPITIIVPPQIHKVCQNPQPTWHALLYEGGR